MKKAHVLAVLLFVSTSFTIAQGIVRGKISDESGESLIGVTVSLKSNKAIGALTDLDGNYSIRIPDDNPQTLIVSYVSYKTAELAIPALTKNQVYVKNHILLSSQTELQEVDVVAKQVKANEYFMENIKKNSATSIDYISSETMKKTGDANVVAAVARVSGVSTSGGLITVRGIGDRYVKTTLNGSRIPTLDPLTNNIKLDLFPASLVDNVIITKTASPDLPGDWSGAYLSVETKDYPDKLTVNVETQVGYNAQTTFKDFISSDRSSTDWLGYDKGLRNRSHDGVLNNPVLNPTSYEEMVALGLGGYYGAMGVTGWQDGSTDGTTYFKLGLVQLGLLAPALINNTAAYNAALATYVKDYKPKAFSKLYPDGTDYNNGFKNNWNTLKRKAPLNFSQSFSVGDQTTLFKRSLGYLFGFRYGSSVRYDPNGISQRKGAEELDYPWEVQDNAFISRQTNGWSALLHLAYKFNGNNSLSFLFMPNLTGTNDVANYVTKPDTSRQQESRNSNQQFYEQRKQLIYQVKSEHFISGPKIKIDFNASYTKANSIAPDFKIIEYAYQRDNSTGEITNILFGPTVGNGVSRFYRYLSDNLFDSRLSAELPISKSTAAGTRKLKFGGAYQQNDRSTRIYDYYLQYGNSNIPAVFTSEADINNYLDPSSFVLTNSSVNLIYTREVLPRNFTTGKSTVKAAFVMVDYSFIPLIRFSGGVRIEQASIFADATEFHNLGYEKNDIRRANADGFPFVNPANINETNFLPSANLIFKLKENKVNQMNFRLNYSQTVARPSMRELNDAAIYDYEFRTLLYGNSDLKTVHIKNYDFRFESYFKNGDNVSLSVFYKDFKNHIEMGFGTSGLTWDNIDKSSVRGIELEGKKSLTKHFELRANVTFVNSNSQFIRKATSIVDGFKIAVPVDTVNRPMFGQAPYLVNGILAYTADSLGLTATLSYNVQGPRLVITGIIKGRPDVYEMPRHTLDFKVSKTLGKHFSTSITVRDILNAPVRRTYKIPGQPNADYDKFRYGTNYLLSVAYKF